MKKILAVFFTATLVADISAGQYGLSGTIKSYYFNSPVASCFIQLRPESPTAKADSMYSDANGRYSFPDVWPGVYTIFVNHTDFLKDSLYLAIDSQKIANFELLKKANVYLTDLPDTLKKALSPIIVGKAIDVHHSLYIQPGVAMILLDNLTIRGASVVANGKKADSISISSRGENIALSIMALTQSYKYCSVKKISAFSTSPDTGTIRCSIDSCRFSNIPSFYNQSTAVIQDNYFENCTVYLQCDTLKFKRNIINTDLTMVINLKGIIANNNFYCTPWINLGSSQDTIINNYIYQPWIDKSANGYLMFAYNDVLNTGFLKLAGVGNPSIRNNNGEPCDLFLNIFSDPQISDSSTGALFSTSPCIRAGQNGTNIGVWQGQGIVTAIASDKNRNPRLSAAGARSDYSLSMQVNSGRASTLQVPASIYSLNGRRLAVLTNTSNDIEKAKPSARASGAYVLDMRFSGKR